LLLDEVLAVGDASFQSRCLQRVNELKRAGTTIVFISHDLAAVERICDRVLLMRRGEITDSGAPLDVIAAYQRAAIEGVAGDKNTLLSGEASVTGVTLAGDDGAEQVGFCAGFRTGDSLRIRIECEAREHVQDAAFDVFFYSQDETLQCQFTTAYGEDRITFGAGDTGAVEFTCDELALQPGLYRVDVTIKHRAAAAGSDIDWRRQCAQLRVDPGKIVRGNFYAPHRFRATTSAVSHDERGGVFRASAEVRGEASSSNEHLSFSLK
jgi:hypothetical protein